VLTETKQTKKLSDNTKNNTVVATADGNTFWVLA